MRTSAMNSQTVALARRFWAGAHGCSPATLERVGPFVTVAPPQPHPSLVLVLHWGLATVVAAPERLLPELRALVDGAATENLQGALIAGLGKLVERVVGPTSLAFADEACLREAGPQPGIALEATEPDDPRLFKLAQACGKTEWEHSGIDEALSVFAAVDTQGDIRSAAAYSLLGDSLAHVGVLTDPAHRGRGLAAMSGYRAASEAIAAGLVAQWQTLVANVASLAVGRRLGFVELGRHFAIRLKT